MIGNLQDARIIWDVVKGLDFPKTSQLPTGWRYIDSGASRDVYLSPEGVVYKICHLYYENRNRENCNDMEFFNSKRLYDCRGWRIAKTSSYCFDDGNLCVTINAMEYVQGVEEQKKEDQPLSDFYDWIEDCFKSFDLKDAGPYNYVLTPEGERVIIDCVM